MSTYEERVLPDDYPVYAGYAYVADGKVVISDIQGRVRDLKRCVGAAEVRSCDIVGRALAAKREGG